MLQITPQQRILLAVRPVDFRRGIDGLVALCRQPLSEDPLGGTLFVFTNRRRTGLKILTYDSQGFWLCQKRFSQGRLLWWPSEAEGAARELAARQLQILLWNGNPEQAVMAPLWRAVVPTPLKPVVPGNSKAAISPGLV